MLVLKLAATVAALAQGVFSEGVHLFNCRPSIGSGSIQTWTAIVAVRRPLADNLGVFGTWADQLSFAISVMCQ